MPTATTSAKSNIKPEAKPDPKRHALGKGLESLLPRSTVVPSISAESAGKPLDLDVNIIERNPWQTRTSFDEAQLDELAQSIRATGVVQPILVRSIGMGKFQLIAGERRLLASKKAGKATIPAIVRQAADEQVLEMTIVENLQRADLNPMEQARAFQRLSQDFKMTQEQMSIVTGKN
ncbi:MAG: ParB/RepB/Spo0J family partition protein, partial [Acidobacteriaceae bacterium]|nr:ParB/RepB/Spo0J family partition protein [Acidobacteriaceae bacterium]